MKNENNDTELSRTLLVLGYIAVKELEGIPEKVKVLNNLGFSNREMAIICNTSDGTIRVQKVLNKGRRKK